MLKLYKWNGSTWQFEEGLAPAGAVEFVPETKKAEPKNKSVEPQNKAVKPKTKGATK